MRKQITVKKVLSGLLLLALICGASYAQKNPKDKFVFGPLEPDQDAQGRKGRAA